MIFCVTVERRRWLASFSVDSYVTCVPVTGGAQPGSISNLLEDDKLDDESTDPS
jgi:hypothetical protein